GQPADEEQLQVVDDLVHARAQLVGGLGQVDALPVEQPRHHRQQPAQPAGRALVGDHQGSSPSWAAATASSAVTTWSRTSSGETSCTSWPAAAASWTREAVPPTRTRSSSQPSSPGRTSPRRRSDEALP